MYILLRSFVFTGLNSYAKGKGSACLIKEEEDCVYTSVCKLTTQGEYEGFVCMYIYIHAFIWDVTTHLKMSQCEYFA
jgi:hypothetical protein